MTAKVTGKVVIIFIMLVSCSQAADNVDELQFQQQLDSAASASIDSAYAIVLNECREKQQTMLPLLVDSLINADSLSGEIQ